MWRGISRVVCAGVVAAAMGAASQAHAQPSPEQQRSMAAFEEGRKLLEKGDCAHAIPKLRESIGHFPSVGARMSLAECYQPDDALAAWRQLKEAELLAQTRHDDRAQIAHARAATLEPRLAMVRIELAAGWEDAATDVRLDDAAVDKSLYRAGAIAVEPGTRSIRVSMAGKAPFSTTVVANVGGVVAVQVPPPTDPVEKVAPPIEQGPTAPAEPSGSTQRTIGLVVGGAGIVLIGVGAVTGLMAISKKNDLETSCAVGGGSFPSNCGGGTFTSAQQEAARSDKSSLGTMTTLSTIGLVVGGIAVATGATLFFLAPKPASTSLALRPRFGADRAELGLERVW